MNVTKADAAAEGAGEQLAAPSATEATAAEPPVESAPTSSAQQRARSMPKSPITRKQADDLARFAVKAVKAIGGVLAAAARQGVRAVKQFWCVIEAVPAAVRLFCVAGVGMLVGVVGAITLHTTLGLICIVVVIPVCAGILGALGHRWYNGLGSEVTRRAQPAESTPSDLQRSVRYVDKKLAAALTSFGTDQHQQAVIALFQAKTAVELTLGTEQDPESYVDLPLRADDYGLRPRIRVGSTSTLQEGNSLAAS